MDRCHLRGREKTIEHLVGVRSGSVAGLREWAILRNWMANQAPRNVIWGVLSVDESKRGGQHPRSEQTPGNGLMGGKTPAVGSFGLDRSASSDGVVRPDGEIQTHHAPLPSDGRSRSSSVGIDIPLRLCVRRDVRATQECSKEFVQHHFDASKRLLKNVL